MQNCIYPNLIKKDSGKLLFSTESLAWEVQERGDMCIHRADSLCCTVETNTTFKAIKLQQQQQQNLKVTA